MRKLRAAAWLAILLTAAHFCVAQTVLYPRAEDELDQRDRYPAALLKLAVAKSGQAEVAQASQVFMLQVRAVREVEKNETLNVMWTMTSAEREETLLPIRIPIDKGLLGWRLLLVRKDRLAQFADIKTSAQLQKLVSGQGADWPDTTILKQGGYTVDESARYNDLFQKLTAGRIDFFPRSVLEVWGELDGRKNEPFAVEPGLALHYPTALYFFVNKKNVPLAADITAGLEAALADGSFEALFQQHFGKLVARSGLASRRVFEIKNPLLPVQTPLNDKRLWLRLH
jgi:ABC-type amino acid transport substrate-binding protein